MQWCEALSCSLLYLHVMWFTASVAASPFSSSYSSSSSSTSTSSNFGLFKPDWMSRLCSCFKKHPQTAFCDSDFVLRVVVLQNPQNRMRRFRGSQQTLINFPVEIREIFKGGHIFLSFSPFRGRLRTRLFSPFMPSCTISSNVQEHKDYVIMGQMVEGKPVVSTCSWIKQKEELTTRQWRGLRSKYEENCHICQIKYCDTSDCPQEQFKCNLNPYSDVSECYHKETFCLRKQSRHLRHGFHCRWASSRVRLGNCIRSNGFCFRNPRLCLDRSSRRSR